MPRRMVWAGNRDLGLAKQGWWSDSLEGMRCQQDLHPWELMWALWLPPSEAGKAGSSSGHTCVPTQPRAPLLSTGPDTRLAQPLEKHSGDSDGAERATDRAGEGELWPAVPGDGIPWVWYPEAIHWSLWGVWGEVRNGGEWTRRLVARRR